MHELCADGADEGCPCVCMSGPYTGQGMCNRYSRQGAHCAQWGGNTSLLRCMRDVESSNACLSWLPASRLSCTGLCAPFACKQTTDCPLLAYTHYLVIWWAPTLETQNLILCCAAAAPRCWRPRARQWRQSQEHSRPRRACRPSAAARRAAGYRASGLAPDACRWGCSAAGALAACVRCCLLAVRLGMRRGPA